MKALFIGGTGIISTSISQLLPGLGWDLTLLNRGSHQDRAPAGVSIIQGDMQDESRIASLLSGLFFDVIVDFIAFRPEQIERDIRLFAGHCDQYIFISSASAYQKPPASWLITESTPLHNPYWQYSRDKAACEQVLVDAYREKGFPVTIVRPSHTYNEWSMPLAIHGKNGPWQTIRRMKEGKPVIVIGDGTSLWTVTHSLDFAAGFIGLMGNVHALGEAVHITSDEALPWNQIYTSVGLAFGVKPVLFHVATETIVAREPSFAGPLLGDKSNTVVFDNTKLKRLVPGFTAKIRFDQGIRMTAAWFEMHPEAQTADPDWDAWTESMIQSQITSQNAPSDVHQRT